MTMNKWHSGIRRLLKIALFTLVVIAVRKDATPAQRQRVRSELNAIYGRVGDATNTFNCFPTPLLGTHTPTSNQWYIVAWNIDELRAVEGTNTAALHQRFQRLQTAAGGTDWVRIDTAEGCTGFNELMEDRHIVFTNDM